MQKNIFNENSSFIVFATSFIISILILSSCNNKKTQASKKVINLDNPDIFILKTEIATYNISLENKNIFIDSISPSTILINVFKPHCNSCLSHAKTLRKLEITHNISVINIMQSTQDKENINFIDQLYTTLGITKNSLNILSVIYKNGTYYQHYEGLIPIEMLQHDIQESNTN